MIKNEECSCFNGSDTPAMVELIYLGFNRFGYLLCYKISIESIYQLIKGYRPIHLSRSDYETVLNVFPRALVDAPVLHKNSRYYCCFFEDSPQEVCTLDGDWPVSMFVGIDPEQIDFLLLKHMLGREAKHNEDPADAHQFIYKYCNVPLSL